MSISLTLSGGSTAELTALSPTGLATYDLTTPIGPCANCSAQLDTAGWPTVDRVELDEDAQRAELHDAADPESAEVLDAADLATLLDAARVTQSAVDMPTLFARLWESFDVYARSQTDDNSRVSISLIALNPASTAQQIERATEWATWWQGLWGVYAAKKAILTSTQTLPETDFANEVGVAPWTIWEISA